MSTTNNPMSANHTKLRRVAFAAGLVGAIGAALALVVSRPSFDATRGTRASSASASSSRARSRARVDARASSATVQAPSGEPDTRLVSDALARVEADQRAFVHDGSGFVAMAPAAEVILRVDGSGARLRATGSARETTLRFGGIGRRRQFTRSPLATPTEGACDARGAMKTDGSCLRRVETNRLEVVEWWENRGHGIEHGFDVAERPGGEGRLELLVEVLGEGIDVEIDESAEGATLVASDDDALRYTGLVVRDAEGRTLDAVLASHPAGFVITIDDASARYPLVVDPIVTSARTTVSPGAGVTGFGTSVAGAGDVNADGYGDLLVGAPTMSNGQLNEGRVYLFLGAATGTAAGAPWTWEPNAAEYRAGQRVSGAGDVNGDGYADVLVGAPATNAAIGGYSYLFTGSSGGLGVSPTWSRTAATKGIEFGTSVAGLGDVNGDGRADFALGSTAFVEVYHGTPSGPPTLAISLSPPGGASSGFGKAVSGGDITGDGFADVLVGAPNNASGPLLGSDEGAVYVYLGSANGVPSSPDTAYFGGNSGANMGASVAVLGDGNGDGIRDFAVGTPGTFGLAACSTCGRVMVYQGGGGLPINPIATIVGATGDMIGTAIASLGDANGDGYADFAIFSPSNPVSGGTAGEGYVRIFYGSASGAAPGSGVQIAGTGSSANISTIAGVGDLNGDGFHDLAIGAAGASAGGSATGLVYVLTGRAGTIRSTTPAVRDGLAIGTNLGARVAFLGDLDGDGDAEFAAAAPGTSNGQAGEGSIEIHSGATGSIAFGASPQTRESNVASAAYGSALAPAGDVNGDGRMDLLVGAAGLSNGQSGEGRIDVYHGASTGLVAATPSFSQESDVANAAFGQAAAAAGDLNGDGYGDVVVGAPGYSNGQANEGAIYVFYGSATGLTATGRTLVESQIDGAQFGASVACAGDVNADGFDDLVVGSPGYANVEASEGRMQVFSGSATGLVATAAFSYEPNSASAQLGTSVAGGFSLSGSPSTTVAAGAPGLTTGGLTSGSVFVFIPSGGTPLIGTPIRVHGSSAGERFGASLAVADFTSDGRGDLAIGAPMTSPGGLANAGSVRVHFASSVGSFAATADITIAGSAAGQQLGTSVSAGDLDGDGMADLLVGAPFVNGAFSGGGRASIFRANGGDSAAASVRGYYQARVRNGLTLAAVQPRAALFGTSANFGFAGSTHAFGSATSKLEIELQTRSVAYGTLGQNVAAAALAQAASSALTIGGLPSQSTVHARGRLRLGPVVAPPFQWTRWIPFGISADPAGNHVRTTAAVVDTDGDGLNDTVEGTLGTNPALADSDGDGIPDGVEVGSNSAAPRNTDGIGAIDALDTDSDQDGILDSVELLVDPDGDSIPAYRDLDSDGDGVSDLNEGASSTDGDGVADFLDSDDDDDGIATSIECASATCANTDGTGLADYRDTDSDDDGILDSVEGTLDPEADGKGAYVDTDADGNGILDSVEGTGNVDGDAFLDFLDLDDDGDGVPDASDNCRITSNMAQNNADGDALGNLCDPDDDNDGLLDAADNCQYTANPLQENNDGDLEGDVCENDDDNDLVTDNVDNCPFVANVSQTDTDGAADGGDACDTDDDNDGVLDVGDNCPLDVNSTQTNLDGDSQGDVCDADDDNDGVADTTDNCPRNANASQVDADSDGLGDACDNCVAGDSDSDGACNGADNCTLVANPDQANSDGDSLGNACDTCPSDAQNDVDGDLVCGNVDNCPSASNAAQTNTDGDALGDACDVCPADAVNDADSDAVCGDLDNCPSVANVSQVDSDSDGAGDACDVCPGDGLNDADADSICGNLDNCPELANSSQIDTDTDALGDVCDACITDEMNDVDGDGICGDVDNCPGVANPGQQDSDPTNPLGDACQNCPDEDTDGICSSQSATLDNCPNDANSDQANLDSDSLGDVCDACPSDPDDDEDADEICGDVDNCPADPNANQADIDGDGTGDACEGVADGGIRLPLDGGNGEVPTTLDPGGCACTVAGGRDPRGAGLATAMLGLLGWLVATRLRRSRARGRSLVAVDATRLPAGLAALAVLVSGCGKILGADEYTTTVAGPCDGDHVVTDQGLCVYDVNALATITTSSGALAPAFDPATPGYALELDVLTRSVRVRPTVLEPTLVTIRVNGQVVASGSDSQAINLTVGDQVLNVEVEPESGNIATYSIRIARGYFDAYVKASNTDAADAFGTSVSMSGDLLAVGAPHEDSSGTSPANSASHTDSGAVYVYARDAATGAWQVEALLKAEDVRAGDAFGQVVALDGTTLVVGAPLANNGTAVDSGATYVFTRDDTGTWTQQARLRASNYAMNDQFGSAVAIVGDLIVAGAPNEDSASGGVGAPGEDEAALDSGAAYAFRRTGVLWAEESLIKAHDPGAADGFGSALALSGATLVVGAPGADDSRSGPGSGTPSTDDALVDAGASYVFEYDLGWTQTAFLKPTDPAAGDAFGFSLAIDGDHLVVGAPYEDSAVVDGFADTSSKSLPNSGAAYYFLRTSGSWAAGETFKAATADVDDLFGWSVAIESTDTDVEIVATAPYEDGSSSSIGATGTSDSTVDSGAAYVFRATTSGVLQTAYVKSIAATTDAAFGHAVALEGGELAITSIEDASTATGVGGDFLLLGADGAGAVFLFR